MPDGDWPLADWPEVFGGSALFDKLVAVLRQLVDVLRSRTGRIAFETGKPVAYIGGVADLAGFAVADNIDASFLLAANGFGHAAPHHFVEVTGIILLAAILCE